MPPIVSRTRSSMRCRTGTARARRAIAAHPYKPVTHAAAMLPATVHCHAGAPPVHASATRPTRDNPNNPVTLSNTIELATRRTCGWRAFTTSIFPTSPPIWPLGSSA
jgi:hypothetical protein